jgi:hypothetical protein
MKKESIRKALVAGAAILLASLTASGAGYSGYSHVTAVEGAASVLSDANGRVDAQLNLPLAAGDRILTHASARLEIELADGNRIQLDGESSLRIDGLAGDAESSPLESAVTLLDGSMAVSSVATTQERALRVDTPDASVYMADPARVRINLDLRRGTNVIVRAGRVEVQTRSGSQSVEAGQYLIVHGDEPPQLAQGTFSRDRFDAWVADRTNTILQAYNSQSARYTEDAYADDTATLDDYGSWSYSSTYGVNVWRPAVSADWCPYTDGYWYYTPVGLTWVSYQPWGWFPFHYGNWFWDLSFNSWCWAPAYVYSPAWVYWAFTPSYVGWCPIGYYSYYAPYGPYWGHRSWRSGVYISVSGVFSTARVDLRGWRFVGVDHVGARFRPGVVMSGQAVRARLGATVAVSSDPIRVSGRAGAAPASVRAYVRAAPASIARSVPASHSATLAPYLARQRELPAATLETVNRRSFASVEARTRQLSGPGAVNLPALAPRAGAGTLRPAAPAPAESWRSSPTVGRQMRAEPGPTAERAPALGRTPPASDWRTRGGALREAPSPRPMAPGETRELGTRGRSPAEAAPPRAAPRPQTRPEAAPRTAPPARPDGRTQGSESWRTRPAAPREVPRTAPPGRGREQAPPKAAPQPAPRTSSGSAQGAAAWRSRQLMPPAQRVIEGIDRGRAVESRAIAPAPAPQRMAPAPQRFERAAPSPRSFPAPSVRPSAPPPRAVAPRSAPRPSSPPPSSSSSHGRSERGGRPH